MKKILTLALGAILLASVAIAETVSFAWTYGTETVDGFRIYAKDNVLVVEVPADVRSASFEETECNSWRILAFLGDLESKISNSTQWCPGPPGAPGDLRIN